MIRYRTLTTLIPLLMTFTPAIAMANDHLLNQALERYSALLPPERAFLRTSTVSSPDRKPETVTERFNPSPSDKTGLLTTYSDLRRIIGDDAQLIESSATRSLYAIRTTNSPAVDLNNGGMRTKIDGDWSGNPLVGTVEVVRDRDGRPYIRRLDLKLAKPFSNALARVNKIDMSYGFEPEPNLDRILVRTFAVDVSMRALLIFKQTARMEVTLADADS